MYLKQKETCSGFGRVRSDISQGFGGLSS